MHLGFLALLHSVLEGRGEGFQIWFSIHKLVVVGQSSNKIPMNRFVAKTAFLVAGALCAAGFIVWPGCAFPPLPASRAPLSIHTRAEFSLKKNGHPSRDEVVARLGPPDEYYADLRVSCYKLNEINRRRLVLLFGILPIAVPRDPVCLEVAMIQFDDHDRAQRREISIIPRYSFPYGAYGYQSTMPAERLRSLVRQEVERWELEASRSPK